MRLFIDGFTEPDLSEDGFLDLLRLVVQKANASCQIVRWSDCGVQPIAPSPGPTDLGKLAPPNQSAHSSTTATALGKRIQEFTCTLEQNALRAHYILSYIELRKLRARVLDDGVSDESLRVIENECNEYVRRLERNPKTHCWE